MVEEFHKKQNLTVNKYPTTVSFKLHEDRYDFMDEEVNEYGCERYEKDNIKNIAKELADIAYTLFGTVVTHGLQDVFESVFKQIHLSNMTKDVKVGDGKVPKGKNYQPPTLTDLIKDWEKSNVNETCEGCGQILSKQSLQYHTDTDCLDYRKMVTGYRS